MKVLFLLLALLGVVACSSPAKSDPRIAVIRQQHQQLLAKQAQAAAQSARLPADRAADAKRSFTDLVRDSEANLQALDQLDPGQSQAPAQVALVTAAAATEAKIIDLADNTLAINQRQLTGRPAAGK